MLSSFLRKLSLLCLLSCFFVGTAYAQTEWSTDFDVEYRGDSVLLTMTVSDIAGGAQDYAMGNSNIAFRIQPAGVLDLTPANIQIVNDGKWGNTNPRYFTNPSNQLFDGDDITSNPPGPQPDLLRWNIVINPQTGVAPFNVDGQPLPEDYVSTGTPDTIFQLLIPILDCASATTFDVLHDTSFAFNSMVAWETGTVPTPAIPGFFIPNNFDAYEIDTTGGTITGQNANPFANFTILEISASPYCSSTEVDVDFDSPLTAAITGRQDANIQYTLYDDINNDGLFDPGDALFRTTLQDPDGDSAVFDAGEVATNNILIVTAEYIRTGSACNGQIGEDSLLIVQAPAPVITPIADDTLCFGDTLTLDYSSLGVIDSIYVTDLNPGAGVGVDYETALTSSLLDPADTTVGDFVQILPRLLIAGGNDSVEVTVFDAGCFALDTIAVSIYPSADNTPAPLTLNFCYEDTITLALNDATADVNFATNPFAAGYNLNITSRFEVDTITDDPLSTYEFTSSALPSDSAIGADFASATPDDYATGVTDAYILFDAPTPAHDAIDLYLVTEASDPLSGGRTCVYYDTVSLVGNPTIAWADTLFPITAALDDTLSLDTLADCGTGTTPLTSTLPGGLWYNPTAPGAATIDFADWTALSATTDVFTISGTDQLNVPNADIADATPGSRANPEGFVSSTIPTPREFLLEVTDASPEACVYRARVLVDVGANFTYAQTAVFLEGLLDTTAANAAVATPVPATAHPSGLQMRVASSSALGGVLGNFEAANINPDPDSTGFYSNVIFGGGPNYFYAPNLKMDAGAIVPVDSVVDLVRIEVYSGGVSEIDGPAGATAQDVAYAWVRYDGVLVPFETAGGTNVNEFGIRFCNATAGNYAMAIRHRNHISAVIEDIAITGTAPTTGVFNTADPFTIDLRDAANAWSVAPFGTGLIDDFDRGFLTAADNADVMPSGNVYQAPWEQGEQINAMDYFFVRSATVAANAPVFNQFDTDGNGATNADDVTFIQDNSDQLLIGPYLPE